jgi:hypothetical protein
MGTGVTNREPPPLSDRDDAAQTPDVHALR